MIIQNALGQKLVIFGLGVTTATVPSFAALSGQSSLAQAQEPVTPGQAEVCAVVTAMPDAADTDELLTLLDTDRAEVIADLEAMSRNMAQYNTEGYGWQNIIDGSSALEPVPGAWLIGALRMACEPQPAAAVTGTVSYRQRIALPPDATLVVTLEDVSRADTASTVIAGQQITTDGQQVPIPFSVVYDPAEIEASHRYVVRAQIFYGGALRWTSTTAYPVITQGNSNEVAIIVEQI